MDKFFHQHGLSLACLVWLVVAGGFSVAVAKDAHSNLSVSANVLAMAHLDLESAPNGIDLTAADIGRGFIDIAEPTTLSVRSNSARGYALEVRALTPMASSIQVNGLDSTLVFGADGGTVVQRWQSPHTVHLALRFRFALTPGLTAGRYPWPLQLAVRPLEAI